MSEPEYLSISETARVLKISRSHVYRLIERKQLHAKRSPLYKYGKVCIPKSDVDALCALGLPPEPPAS